MVQLSLRKGPPCAKFSCHGTELTCIIDSSVLRRGQPNSGEGCIMLQSGPTCSLLAKFPHIQSSLAVCEFCASVDERCERGHGWVYTHLWCLMSWRPKRIKTITATCMLAQRTSTFGFTMQEFSMVSGYTKNPEKPQNWEVGACVGMGTIRYRYRE